MGTRRAAGTAVVTQLAGVLGAAAFLAIVSGHGWLWADQTVLTRDVGFSAGALGAASAATVTLSAPWRGRARIAPGHLRGRVLRVRRRPLGPRAPPGGGRRPRPGATPRRVAQRRPRRPRPAQADQAGIPAARGRQLRRVGARRADRAAGGGRRPPGHRHARHRGRVRLRPGLHRAVVARGSGTAQGAPEGVAGGRVRDRGVPGRSPRSRGRPGGAIRARLARPDVHAGVHPGASGDPRGRAEGLRQPLASPLATDRRLTARTSLRGRARTGAGPAASRAARRTGSPG